MATINLDLTQIYAAGNAARKSIKTSERMEATMKLSQYKMKYMGKKLSDEEINSIRPLVWEMRQKGWLSAEDVQWCAEKHIFYFSHL